MKQCCICNNEIKNAEPAILFIGKNDNEKEICTECEKQINIMTNSNSINEIKSALNYLNPYALKNVDEEVSSYLKDVLEANSSVIDDYEINNRYTSCEVKVALNDNNHYSKDDKETGIIISKDLLLKSLAVVSSTVLIILVFLKWFTISIVGGIDFSGLSPSTYSLFDILNMPSIEYIDLTAVYIVSAFLLVLILIAVLLLCVFMFQLYRNRINYIRTGKKAFSLIFLVSMIIVLAVIIINLYYSHQVEDAIGVRTSLIELNAVFYIIVALSFINRFFIISNLQNESHCENIHELNELQCLNTLDNSDIEDDDSRILQKQCPNCGNYYDIDYPKCPYCKFRNTI